MPPAVTSKPSGNIAASTRRSRRAPLDSLGYIASTPDDDAAADVDSEQSQPLRRSDPALVKPSLEPAPRAAGIKHAISATSCKAFRRHCEQRFDSLIDPVITTPGDRRARRWKIARTCKTITRQTEPRLRGRHPSKPSSPFDPSRTLGVTPSPDGRSRSKCWPQRPIPPPTGSLSLPGIRRRF